MSHDPTQLQQSRVTTLGTLSAGEFDIVVVGGGITGAGVARDAAMRGFRVALVERNDLAAGTSSRSSRLIHGGLRYLEHGHVPLVFESLRERRTLMRSAPHLVRPLAFTWPVYRGARVPRWKLAAGLALYGALALYSDGARAKSLSTSGVLAREPHLRSDGLRGGAVYQDARTNDIRLTIATARSAEQHGAIVLNHANVEELIREGDTVRGVVVRDTLSGQVVRIRSRLVIGAAGPWTDSLTRLVNPGASTSVRGSRGSHVLIRRSRVGNAEAITWLSPVDGRVMFILPAGQFALVGTTEVEHRGSADEAQATPEEVRYLIDSANAAFPKAGLTTRDVIAAWAGIRPLAVSGASNAGSASREHAVVRTAPGMLVATGGKLTTYRAMAADIVDRASGELGVKAQRSATDTELLPGGDVGSLDDATAAATEATGDGVVAAHMVAYYGAEWPRVWWYASENPTLGARLHPDHPYVLAELAWAVRHEWARTLGDLLIRRTQLAFETEDNARGVAEKVARLVSPWLGWDEARMDRELADYDREAESIFGGWRTQS